LRLKIPHKLAVFIFLSLIFFLALIYFTQPPLRQLPAEEIKRIFFLAVILGFLLATISGYLIFAWVKRPVQKISRALDQLWPGSSSRISVKADDIEDLARAMDVMSQKINEDVNDIMTHKSHLEAVFLSMFEGVMVLDSQGAIMLMNQPLKDLLHVTHDPTGHRPLEIVRNIDIQDIIETSLRTPSSLISKEIVLFFAQDEKILRVHASSIQYEGKAEGVVLVFHDISDLRRLENIRKDFVANVSHELRTPVATIRGYAETLLDGALDDKENAKEFLRIIHADSERLSLLINDLLDLSRLESGKIIMDFKPSHLRSLVDQVLIRLNVLAQEKRITISNQIPENSPSVLADQASISQVFFNLIENAIKYNNPEGKIVILAQDKENHVEIRIEDTGIGIPPDEIPRVFERFYRVDKAHSRQLGGTGLGLSIVKHIIKLHEGEIFAQSRLGEGSTFVLTLPKA
jgi:two-component system phosphate regulon sensor histidine kinase PhoR